MSNLIQLINHPNHIIEVRLNRPDKRNAMSFALLRELLKVGEQLHEQRQIRAVILTGEGSSFSAGIDLNDLQSPKNSITAMWELSKPGPNLFQRVFLVWRDLPVPVIAAIHGHCFGAGMQLALGADFRIATPDAQLAIMEARWGLVPDMAITATLRGLIGLDMAKELTMTARIISGTQAKSVGLVSHVADEPINKALELAAEIATRSPDAVLAAKRVLNAMVSQPESDTLALEKRWQRRLLLGKNFKIAGKRAKTPELDYVQREFD
nr:crotonase/enoyl-CoA hydratase family protein [Agitococcus sp.]